jgi:hypothetical protein
LADYVILGGDPSHWSLSEEEKVRRPFGAALAAIQTALVRRRRQQTV